MNSSPLHMVPLIGLALVASPRAAAAVSDIAIYNFENGTTPLASVDTDPNSTAGSMVVSSTISANSFRSSAGFNYYVRTVATAANEADSFSGDQYFSFTVNPQPGLVLNLSSFSFGMSPTQPGAYPYEGSTFLRSSVDGYAANLDTFTKEATTAASFSTRLIDLSGSQYQNLAGPVTFRIYFYDNSSVPTGTSTAVVSRIDNVVIRGEAVPEPSVPVMLGTIGCIMLLRRRK